MSENNETKYTYIVTCDCQNLSYKEVCGHKYDTQEEMNNRLKMARFSYFDKPPYKFRSLAPVYNIYNMCLDMEPNVIYQTEERDNYDCCQLFVVKTDKNCNRNAYYDGSNEYIVEGLSNDIIFGGGSNGCDK